MTRPPAPRLATRRAFLRGDLRGTPAGASAASRVVIAQSCLLQRGVLCRTCTDSCEQRALRYRPRAGGAGVIEADADACTGCGDCLPVCPAGALELAVAAAPAA